MKNAAPPLFPPLRALDLLAGFFRPALLCAACAGWAAIATAQPSPFYLPYQVKPFAGQAAPGSADGPAANAQFNHPSGVALDVQGNVYVADTDNHTIRKIDRNGAVTTIAGSAGQAGSADGYGAAARFNHPFSLALDELLNIYVADTDNHTIRKIDQNNNNSVTTLAGLAGQPGNADGTGTAARFDNPKGVTVGAGNIVWVADTDNHTIRSITQGGTVQTEAGLAGTLGSSDGVGSAARFSGPEGIAVNFANALLVSDTRNGLVRNLNTSPGAPVKVTTPSIPPFNAAAGIAAAGNGDYYVAVTNDHTIRAVLISVSGEILLAGKTGTPGNVNGLGAAALLNRPTGLAVVPGNSRPVEKIYIADSQNNQIRLAERVPPPVITVQPQSITVPVGGTFSLSVAATCSVPISYQWLQSGSTSALPNSTGATYTKTNAQLTDAGQYVVDVYVTGSIPGMPGASTRSTVATVTVTPPPPPPSHGKGGAPSLWFFAMLALAAAARLLVKLRNMPAG